MKAPPGTGNAQEDSFPLAEDRFRILTEVVAAAVVIYQGDRILYANRSAEALCGRTRDMLVGQRLSDIVHQDHRDRVLERALARQRRETVPRRYEFKILTGDGHERWVEFTGEYLEIAGKPAALGTLYDITEHRRALAVLLEAEQKYTELFESCEEGIFRGTPGGALLQVNPSFARGLGYDSPQELMERVTDISREIFADQGRHADLMKALEEKGSVRGFEAPLHGSGGETQWVSISANALFAEDLTLHSYSAFTYDITQRRTMERQLLQSQKMEAIGRLAGGIAHDFNNILTVILGYCEMLRDVIPGNGEGQGVLREIGSAAKRAAMLTQQLLAFSRQQVVQRKILDVNVVVRAMETMVKRLIGENIELVTELEKESATVRADPHQIEQIIMNLVVNARDAMPEGGTLRISTSRRSIFDVPADAATGAKPGRYVELGVTDSGVGISAEVLPLIFEPFFTTKKSGEGTGLGLSTVYGIAQQDGGFVSVESEPGKGARFRVCLPQEKGKPVEEEGRRRRARRENARGPCSLSRTIRWCGR